MPTRARVVLTPGEPAGIGPDIAIQLAARPLDSDLLVVADPGLINRRARQLGININVQTVEQPHQPTPHAAGRLHVLPVALDNPVRPGQLDPANAGYVLNTLKRATRLCLDGECDALVTGPVNKAIINAAGTTFSGHTGYLAQLTGARLPVMMLASQALRVALATIHLPLRAVPDAITQTGLRATLQVLDHDLRSRFGIAKPHILVAGLNPHAGESGYLGREEIDVITPVVQQMQTRGMHLTGPLPADTLFTPRHLDTADAVLAMYHDQGLPVIKHAGFGQTVNVTLGLPIIRTSVDHGTALELAGSGQANFGSLQAAVAMAATLATTARRATAASSRTVT